MQSEELRATLAEGARRGTGHGWQPATVVAYKPFAGRGGIALIKIDGPDPSTINAMNVTGSELSVGDRVQCVFDPPAGVYVIGRITTAPATPSSLPPWGMLTAYSKTVAAQTAVSPDWCRFDSSPDFGDWFSYNANGFTALTAVIFEIGFQVIWDVPDAFDYPRTGGGADFSPFGLHATIGSDETDASDQDMGFNWPRAQMIFTDDMINANTFSNALASVADNYDLWELTGSGILMWDSGQHAQLFVARSNNDGSHNGTDLGGFSISGARMWIKPLVETTSSQQPIDDNFVTDSTLCN